MRAYWHIIASVGHHGLRNDEDGFILPSRALSIYLQHLIVAHGNLTDTRSAGPAVGTGTAACARHSASGQGPDAIRNGPGAPAAAPRAGLPPRAPGPASLLGQVAGQPSPDTNPDKSPRRRALTAQAAVELRHWLKGAQIPRHAQTRRGQAGAKAPASADGPGGRAPLGAATLGGGTAQPGASALLGWLRRATHAPGGATTVVKGPNPSRWLRPSPHAMRPSRVAPVDLPSSPVTPRRQNSLPTAPAAASSAAQEQWGAGGLGGPTAEQGRQLETSMPSVAGQQRDAQAAAGRSSIAEKPGNLDLMRIARLAGAVGP